MAQLIRAAGRYALEPQHLREPFESLARAIAHQQLNGTAAGHILARFTALYGDAFPTPQQVLETADAPLRAAGFSFAKIAALKDLAAKSAGGIVPHKDELKRLEDHDIITRLTEVRGIGRWTVEMMLIFQLGRPDVLPVDDFGIRNGFRLAYGLKGMPRPKALAEFGERWQPHRTMAAWYLWRAVDLSRAQRLPARVGRAPRIALLPQPKLKLKPKLKKKAAPPARAHK
jgi:DNA-3-methyladenine glycosylase II